MEQPPRGWYGDETGEPEFTRVLFVRRTMPGSRVAGLGAVVMGAPQLEKPG